MKSQVPSLRKKLENSATYDEIGYILDEAWSAKKELSDKISNDTIDKMYTKARSAGALGGKISGAGGGGFLMLYVPRERQNSVRSELKEFREFPFMLERDGSKIIFNIKREYWK